MRMLLCTLAVLISAAAQAASKDYKPLFDGKTLAGWTALPGGDWYVEDGVIVGRQKKTEKRHGQLISNVEYGNFILKLQYRALKGNSGVYFRVQKVDHAVAVKGFQAEVDANGNGVGGLYETLGRAWVTKPSQEAIAGFYKKHEWNDMTVAAVGGDITVVVNGVITAQLKDDPGLRKGHIAFQLHGRQDMDIAYRGIRIRELPTDNYPIVLDEIHDKSRAHPPIVEPKPIAELEPSRKPPAGAAVLFDGTTLDAWNGNWEVKDGFFQRGKGNLSTKEQFGDCHLHIEWKVVDAKRSGNSGVFMMGQIEVQVFNSHQNRTPIYADGQAAAIYGQYPPSVNACRPPGEWEVYDIHFTAPTFADGKLKTPARVTVIHNGHKVHDDVVATGPTSHYRRPFYTANRTSGPVLLQDHGDIIAYRNVWIVKK